MLASKPKEELKFLLFISPWIIGFLAFFVGPAIVSLVFSFADYNTITKPEWIGLDNYTHLLKDKIFIKAFTNTLFFVGFAVPVTVVFQILTAVILNFEVKGIRFFRTLYYLPYLVPPVATVIIWQLMFGMDNGFINELLSVFGVNKIDWFGTEVLIKPLVVSIGVWMSGGPVLVYLAALKNIPSHLYEAAKIDGASPIRSFFNITLPMLTPSILFALVMQIIFYFQMFTEAKLLTDGGPNYASRTYVMNIYQSAFQDMKFGYAMAQSWVLFIIILVLTLIVMKTSNRWVFYESEKGS